MLLGVRIVLSVPLRYKFEPISPRDADTANALCLESWYVPAVCELPVSLCEREFVPSDCDIKMNTIHEGWCSFLWRRKRDSNPRAFWANGFQDRLVVTASIFLHITATHRAAVICREYLHGSEKFIFQNPLRIPHEVNGELAHPLRVWVSSS